MTVSYKRRKASKIRYTVHDVTHAYLKCGGEEEGIHACLCACCHGSYVELTTLSQLAETRIKNTKHAQSYQKCNVFFDLIVSFFLL